MTVERFLAILSVCATLVIAGLSYLYLGPSPVSLDDFEKEEIILAGYNWTELPKGTCLDLQSEDDSKYRIDYDVKKYFNKKEFDQRIQKNHKLSVYKIRSEHDVTGLKRVYGVEDDQNVYMDVNEYLQKFKPDIWDILFLIVLGVGDLYVIGCYIGLKKGWITML